MVVPSSTPAYNTTYCPTYLEARGSGWIADGLPSEAADLVCAVRSDQAPARVTHSDTTEDEDGGWW